MMLPSNGSLEVIESSANSGQLKKQNPVVQLAKFNQQKWINVKVFISSMDMIYRSGESNQIC